MSASSPFKPVNFTTRPDVLEFIIKYFDSTGCYQCANLGEADCYSIFYLAKDGGSECGWIYDKEEYIEVELGNLEELAALLQKFDHKLYCSLSSLNNRFLSIFHLSNGEVAA
ncbi:hypothetical protein [Brasilonema bromeliae]|uniref:Uncharacterized protein n=1 Tax=Brasilonema bromeliae SPC951 TaxID=385972 RepID=A0ABX1PBA9_9CYAN|nr:hypothetical protein [Brasilonema bromeliae]NMG20717.1 hypothetical protein [Brasilonema bromeliae SPC951]